MIFNDKTFIAKKIKLARKKAKLTQEELAEQIGISAKQLSRIEIGTYIPSLPTFLKIVKILDIDLNDFGIDIKKTDNSTRNKFIEIIYKLTDSELEYYFNILQFMIKQSETLKK